MVFKIPGFVCKRFLPFFLTPSPLFYLRHLSRGQFDSRSSFFAPRLHRNACYASYVRLGRLCLKMQIQGNPKFNPFSRIRRFSSSKNINSFFRNLQRFQTLPRVSSRPLNKVSSTLHWRDALSQSSKTRTENIQKHFHRNLRRAFDVCSQMPSNSKKRFGLVVNEFYELEHIRISNRGDGFQNTSPEQPSTLNNYDYDGFLLPYRNRNFQTNIEFS